MKAVEPFIASLARGAGSGGGSRPWTLNDSLTVVGLVGLLIVGVLLAGAVVMALRRRMLQKDSPMSAAGSLMEELRRMRERGEISAAEYDAARAAATRRLARNSGPGAPAGAAQGSAPIRRSEGAVIARPGFDLTGAPLPRSLEGPPPDTSGSQGE